MNLNISKIIFILGVIGVVIYITTSLKNPLDSLQVSRDMQRKNDLKRIQTGLNSYYNDHGLYPLNSEQYQIIDTMIILPGTNWEPYIQTFPQDPGSNHYVYIVDLPGRQSYRLYASLEQGAKDPEACQGTPNNKCPFAPLNACGSVCNYGITSPNTSP